MNTSFKEWLELQESLPANLAMMLGSMMPSSDVEIKKMPQTVSVMQDRSIQDEFDEMSDRLEFINRNFESFKNQFMISIQNKKIHPVDPFTHIISTDPKQLKKIRNIDILEARLNQIETLMQVIESRVEKMKSGLSEPEAKDTDKMIQMATRADNFMKVKGLVDMIYGIVKKYMKPVVSDEKRAATDMYELMHLDDIAALDLEMVNDWLKDLD